MTKVPPAPKPLHFPNGEDARAAWPLESGFLHVNHGSFGAVPRVALEAQDAMKREMEGLPVKWFINLPDRIAASRREISQRLSLDPERTAFVPNASAGASIVYRSSVFPEGSEVVVTNHGYGAVTMGAELAVRRVGGKIVTANIPIDCSAEVAHDAVMELVTARTALVVVDQITSPTALQLPVQEISASVRLAGAQILVDGAHAPGLIDQPLLDLDAHFWTGNLHKWPCAPRGCGLFVAASDVSQDMFPVIDSWGNPLPYPERFDHQGTLDQTALLAATRSWDFIEETWGWPAAREYMEDLVSYGAAVIAHAFEEITGLDHRAGAILTVPGLRLVRLPDGLVTDSAGPNRLRDVMMREHGLQAAFTAHDGQGYVRLSAHVYNTPADYEEFAERIVPVLCNRATSLGSAHAGATPLGVPS